MDFKEFISLLAAALLVWAARAATGRQPVADGVETPARWLADGGVRAAGFGTALSGALPLLYGVMLGGTLGVLRDVGALFSLLLPVPSGTGLAAFNTLLLLGVLRIPRRSDVTPERLARDLVGPAVLLLLVGPWAAYGFRAAVAASDTPSAPKWLVRMAVLCAAPAAAAVRLAGRVVCGAAAVDETPAPTGARPAVVVGTALLVAATVAAVAIPLVHLPGFYECSEEMAYPHRVWALDEQLRHGVWYPRLFPHFAWGFGYPFLNYYAPLTYYLAELGRLAALSYLGAVKALAGLIPAGAAAAMFFLARERWGALPALVAAAGYGTCGYLLVDVYTRGALAEALCFVWLPLCFRAVTAAPDARWGRQVAACAVPVTLLCLTHNITALLAVPVLLATALPAGRAVARVPAAAAGVLLGLGVAAFFWLPALTEKRFVSIERMLQVTYDFAFPVHLLALTGEPFPAKASAVPFQGGTLACLFGCIPLVLMGCRSFPASSAGLRERCMIVLLAGSVLLTLPLSDRAWKAVPLFGYIQFPYRLATFACLSLCYLAAWGIALLLKPGQVPARTLARSVLLAAGVTALPSLINLARSAGTSYNPISLTCERLVGVTLLAVLSLAWIHRCRKSLAACLVLTALLMNLYVGGVQARLRCEPARVEREAFTWPWFHQRELEPDYIGTTARGEYLPIWAPSQRPAEPPGTLVTTAGTVTAESERGATGGSWTVETPLETTLTYRAFYFPGWQGWVDGRQVRTGPSRDGLVTWETPPGWHRVRVSFEDTPVRRVGWWISGLSLLLLLGCRFIRLREAEPSSPFRGRRSGIPPAHTPGELDHPPQ